MVSAAPIITPYRNDVCGIAQWSGRRTIRGNPIKLVRGGDNNLTFNIYSYGKRLVAEKLSPGFHGPDAILLI
jgi:hypothetical protein